ncbi:ATP-binding protein [Streptomyces sp. OfavH-34-F]|uniref:AAA family ATPase n=1 Tax=Streptomyces sp. OfavH-34-F TaxID=2917760 RepID=UPI001EF3AACD|nr:ATP-binding protein [Streptomyces sp. OfavH-34-F]MCG7528059.1 ATP-binding protein [Streptomyces sp. OfavH-34-F]
MPLLGFTVRNHKSIRDEITLDLTRPSLRTLRPRDDDWNGVTYPLAGVFGANATGKSSVLDALRYTFSAISQSATAWQASKGMRRAPFRLDGSVRTASSTYELDFVHAGHRHAYGFEVDHDGIRREWLRDVPGSRWRTLLDRDRDTGVLKFHPSLRGRIDVTGRELVLSRALLFNESSLHTIARELVDRFDCVLVKDSPREARLRDIADSLAEGTITFPDVEALLQVAGIGVDGVSLEETETPKEVRRHLAFPHRGSADERPQFSIHEESDGTIAWLATAVPAVEALRKGGLLIVDEIDSSLHPHLLEVLLGAFADPAVNTRQAQLIFTSHESYILSPLSDVKLEPEQVWFTDKTYDGVTELTCLADFPRHPDANVARRYLAGRYGGTPHLSPSTLTALIVSGEDRGSGPP